MSDNEKHRAVDTMLYVTDLTHIEHIMGLYEKGLRTPDEAMQNIINYVLTFYGKPVS